MAYLICYLLLTIISRTCLRGFDEKSGIIPFSYQGGISSGPSVPSLSPPRPGVPLWPRRFTPAWGNMVL